MFGGSAIASYLGAFFAEKIGFKVVFLITAMFVIIGIIILFLLEIKNKKTKKLTIFKNSAIFNLFNK